MYTVQQGDCLSSIAHARRLADWRIIDDHPNNASFRNLRSDPNVIFPGDELFVPDLTQKIQDAPTDQRHLFQLKSALVLLRTVLLDEKHEPLRGVPYKLDIEGAIVQGKTDSSGLLE